MFVKHSQSNISKILVEKLIQKYLFNYCIVIQFIRNDIKRKAQENTGNRKNEFVKVL